MNKQKKLKKILSLHISEELHLKLSEQAKIEERSLSQVIRMILSKHLEKKNENK